MSEKNSVVFAWQEEVVSGQEIFFTACALCLEHQKESPWRDWLEEDQMHPDLWHSLIGPGAGMEYKESRTACTASRGAPKEMSLTTWKSTSCGLLYCKMHTPGPKLFF